MWLSSMFGSFYECNECDDVVAIESKEETRISSGDNGLWVHGKVTCSKEGLG